MEMANTGGNFGNTLLGLSLECCKFISESMVPCIIIPFNMTLSERMSEDVSERISKDMSERMSEEISERISEECLKDMSEKMSEDLSEDMSEKCQKICPLEC